MIRLRMMVKLVTEESIAVDIVAVAVAVAAAAVTRRLNYSDYQELA